MITRIHNLAQERNANTELHKTGPTVNGHYSEVYIGMVERGW